MNYQEGQELYLRTGQLVHYLCKADKGHVVEPRCVGLHGDEEYEYSNRPLFIHDGDELLDRAPVEKYDSRVKELEVRERELQDRLEILRGQCREAESERSRLLARLTKIEELKHIEAFLDGKFTHAVVNDGYGRVTVQDFDQLMTDPDRRYSGEIRLLSLFGTKDKKVLWKRNAYYDGSGSWTKMIPCLSIEEANEKAREIIEALLASPENDYKRNQAIESADRLGVPVPQELLDAKKAAEEKEKADKLAKLQKEMEALSHQ